MSSTNGRAQGKVALITGGSGGIGRAIGRRLGLEGARVALTDLDREQVARAVEALAAENVSAIGLVHDVRDETSWKHVVRETCDRLGPLNVLVNNAGVGAPPRDGFEYITIDDWRSVMSVNLDGVFLGVREGVLAMKERGGSIVNIGSIAAYVGTPGGAAYGGSKGGVRTLTKQAAVSCARKGYPIRINAVHPCYIRTPLAEAAAAANVGSDKAVEALKDRHPFRVLGEPDDVAWVVLFLASDESRLINAADIVVDGAYLSV